MPEPDPELDPAAAADPVRATVPTPDPAFRSVAALGFAATVGARIAVSVLAGDSRIAGRGGAAAFSGGRFSVLAQPPRIAITTTPNMRRLENDGPFRMCASDFALRMFSVPVGREPLGLLQSIPYQHRIL